MAKVFNLEAQLKGLEGFQGEISQEIIADLRNMADTLSKSVYATGVSYVQKRLHSTANEYLQNFTREQVDDSTYVIRLLPAALHLEEGYKSFDMKPGLLKGAKKVSKKGIRYTIIPFRRKTLSAATNLGEQLLATELKQGMKAGTRRDTKKAANLNKTQYTPSGKPMQGIVGRINDDVHKNLKGTVKIQKTYNKTTQSTYITFRTVSSNSPPASWIHPGFKGAHIFPDLEDWAEQEVERVLQSYQSK